jgi:hypothetical protein
MLEHELGHAFDARNLDADERAYLVTDLGYPPDTPWENLAREVPGGDLLCRYLACPNEQFADAYAGCALGYHLTTSRGAVLSTRGRATSAWWSGYGWRADRARYRSVCSSIRAFADPNPAP